jgi:hypothetical protein
MRGSKTQAPVVLIGMAAITGLVLGELLIGGGPASAQTIAVTDRDCAQIVEYVASADVNYEPGVDVYGRPVVPADLNAQPQVQMPQSFIFDANIDLRKYGIPASSPFLLPSTNVGRIRVEDGGRSVYFNDQPVGSTEQQALAAACKARQATPQRR